MKSNKVELGIDDDQLQRGTMDAANLKLTLWEYIRRTVDAYSNIVHQHDVEVYEQCLIEKKPEK